MSNKTIFVYGGTFSGVAAAAKAATFSPDDVEIYVINPDVSGMLGGIGTAGGQNFFDLRSDRINNADYLYTGGSFRDWYEEFGQSYGVQEMSDHLTYYLTRFNAQCERIKIRKGYDVESFVKENGILKSVTIREIFRSNSTGYINWGSIHSRVTIEADVFIDASDDGRLARITEAGVTTGRADWSHTYVNSDEKECPYKPHQQAATLMFKVKGVVTDVNAANHHLAVGYRTRYKGVTDDYSELGVQTIVNFNNYYVNNGYLIKPYNAAHDASSMVDSTENPSNWEWWVNVLLVFNVDGRALERDRTTGFFPDDIRDDYKTVDQAWVDAKNFLNANKVDIRNALKAFNNFDNDNFDFVYDDNGDIVVADSMYIRETIHTCHHPCVNNAGYNPYNRENSDLCYGLTTTEALDTGSYSSDNCDPNYSTRIGLNYYQADINAYTRDDLQNDSGNYIWDHEVSVKLRNDIFIDDNDDSNNNPTAPCYMPYNVLTTYHVDNLLVCGAACSVSSIAWSEIRVLPNLTVLGDAAGVAAAIAVTNECAPVDFTGEEIMNMQEKLQNIPNGYPAVLEKTDAFMRL